MTPAEVKQKVQANHQAWLQKYLEGCNWHLVHKYPNFPINIARELLGSEKASDLILEDAAKFYSAKGWTVSWNNDGLVFTGPQEDK